MVSGAMCRGFESLQVRPEKGDRIKGFLDRAANVMDMQKIIPLIVSPFFDYKTNNIGFTL